MTDLLPTLALLAPAAVLVFALTARAWYRWRERGERRRAAEGVEAARVRIRARSYTMGSWRQE